MKTKFIAISLGVALLLASNVSSVADASWLSKAMDRLETSNAKLSPTWPKAEQYRHYRPIVWYMIVSNRDAVTARGIAVGDSLKKVMDIYGRPDFIDFNNRWFYGYLRYNSDNIVGIFFEHNGSKVTKIIISDN